ncbi:MAG: SusD/RagB family nutrient-binding outer membrane lipoprotein [Flavobacterium sp.]|nr:MAG: SusD/RagB family nutrient-binding outer membrane lipoprotein [Flavobacterium sp.]
MKKKIVSIMFLAAMFTIGCDNNSDEFNNNHDAAYDVSPEALLTNAEKQLVDEVTTGSVNFSPFRFFDQYWGQVIYNTESRYSLTSRTVTDNVWNELYRDVLGNLASASRLIEAEDVTNQAQHDNKLAIIEILNVYTYQVLVDSFGDVPYTQALDPEIKLPAYDNDADIYPQLITRLDAAIAQLDTSAPSFGNAEMIYNGDVAHWIMFANSLKVKLGLNLADVNPTLAQATVESGYNGGVILNNADNATFEYSSSAPNYNQLYADLVASNRTDFVPAATIVNALNATNDPRESVYFTQAASGGYVGGVYGGTNTNFATLSQIGNIFKTPDLPGQLMESTEVNLYLAEAAARGYNVGNTAEFYYNQGVTESFRFWGLSDAQAATYLAQPNVAYATAPGDFKQKIGMQMWYSFYNRPFEEWNAYRRLDYPQLAAPSNASSTADGEVPKRLFYPINERTVNSENYQAAVQAIGGSDRMKVHVFWDVN